ncbi:hypothetical protein [Lentilactobacillus parabuchneri]|jgi:hypothetical protein|uniref:hypothetical protein n=1 Tax=Lentilactobacillus parabuchneri TaxID=152331 RepID=UPI000A120A3C|nr:hypothetical protein [Lentilactobacillus parabuchneri]ORN02871.1 hypothetical protein FAM21829_02017 [Lentilactobacillus parabuchneri]
MAIVLLLILGIACIWMFFTRWVWWILGITILINIFTWWDKLIDFLFGNLVTGLGILLFLILVIINEIPACFHHPTYLQRFRARNN